MTQEEVEAVIGLPPGDYGTFLVVVDVMHPRADKTEWWFSDEGDIVVGFDEKEKVLWKRFLKSSPQPTWYERLKYRIGRMFPL